jgi:hypothetical protein
MPENTAAQAPPGYVYPEYRYPWQLPGAAARPRDPALPVRAHGDWRLAAGAAAGGTGCDLAARAGLSTIAGTGWVIVAAGSLLLSRRVRGRTGRLCLIAAMFFGVLLSLRASPWVIIPATSAVVVMLILGASLGADSSGPAATFAGLASRIWTAAGHVITAPGMLRVPGGAGLARRRGFAAARGAALAAPVLLIVGVLLAAADPIFRSWFDLPGLGQHVLLIAAGAWAVLGLGRAASAQRPAPALPSAPALGTVEAAVLLGGLCALYAAFVGAQLEALSGAGHRILVTSGLTYAQYARGGFFELLSCAAITLVALLSVRACTGSGSRALTAICGLTIALTLAVVISAIRRLQLYEAAFGLTLLRLACLVAAAWIGIVFLLLAACLVRRGLPSRYFPAAVIISGLVTIAAWGIGNPAAFVAATNVARAQHGRTLDITQAGSLGPDAVPALIPELNRLDPADRAALTAAMCAAVNGRDSGTAFNLARFEARRDLRSTCASG